MNLEDFISELDSKRFGFKIAKINNYKYNVKELLYFLKSQQVKLVISRISLNNIAIINELEQNGFEIKDIQATYKFNLSQLENYFISKSANIKLRDAVIKDREELEKIALASFQNYGHYAANGKLDKTACNEIYGDWINRSLTNANVADKIVVAEIQGEIAGFLSFKIYSNTTNRYAAGGIGAVSTKFRNQAIFKQISYKGLEWGKEKELDWIEHNVLITNYPINKSFSKQGFSISATFATLHKWIE